MDHLFPTIAVFFAAGLVKGIVGLGLPTISMALLALWMSPAEAAALLIVPSFLTNVWQLGPVSTLRPIARRLAAMQIGVVAGTLAAAWWLGAPSGAWAEVALGIAVVAYAAWGLSGARLHLEPRIERIAGPLVGGATGVVTAATGVFAVPAVPYLQALGLDKTALIQAMGLSFTVSTVALAIGLAINGRLGAGNATMSLLLVLPAIAGMVAGTRIRDRMSPDVFRRCFLAGLLLLGLHMSIQPLMH